MTSHKWLVTTAAKGIQGYVLGSDKLKEMVGASELIEQLGHRALDASLNAAGVEADKGCTILTRAAGGARVLFESEDKARTFLRVWPVIISVYAPGLETSQGIVELKTPDLMSAVSDAEYQVTVNRNLPAPTLPVPGPLVERNRRSGKAAIRKNPDSGESVSNPYVDEEASRKIAVASDGQKTLLKKILPKEHEHLADEKELWPLNFHHLVDGDSAYLAIVHADANGLGKLVMNLRKKMPANSSLDDQIKLYGTFSSRIEEATKFAAQEALKPIIEAANKKGIIIPFRPIVLAGDDFTVVMRAGDAAAFIETYLQTFAAKSERLFKEEPLKEMKLEGLHACAGIAFVKVAYPFAKGYELCESLCANAKKETKRALTALSFARVTTSISGNFPEIREKELTTRDQAALLTMMPYTVGTAAHGHPRFEDLRDLVNVLKTGSKSAFREVVTKAQTSTLAEALTRWERTCEILNESKRWEAAFPELKNRLQGLTGDRGTDCPLFTPVPASSNAPRRTPLWDALELGHLEQPRD